MQELPPFERNFLDKLREVIQQQMAHEQFGVSELAEEVGMSRSNLLRRVKKITGQSVSQFIREVRLEKAMELLKTGALNVSEVSEQVGFASASYFVKCFREQYGYPPGEVSKRMETIAHEVPPAPASGIRVPLLIVAGIFILLLVVFLLSRPDRENEILEEKSIAVLPFINDSSDSSNVYLINGLMESTLINLQKIADLRVISRTSTEKYRNSTKTIPEMAKELNVKYFVEGSGQKIGDRILLNIQLIEAATDKHLWARQYERNTSDIFKLQQEIAQNIAGEVQAIITPKEQAQIEKIPTDNLEAYDQFLKGRDLLVIGDDEKTMRSLPYFKKATELDPGFAHAYAALTVAYYYLDIFQADKKFAKEIHQSADKAMLNDPKLPESLIAKALTFMYDEDYSSVAPYLEKALEYNPNSTDVINLLSDLYANYTPNTAKYLEYALRGEQLAATSTDSMTRSFLYLHLSNALIQTGFVEEALYYVNKSIDYERDNGFSNLLKAFVLYAKEKDMNRLKDRLIVEWKKDSSRLDILQEVGKVCYFMRDYEEAYYYYSIFLDMREQMKLDIYRYEHGKIAVVLEAMGKNKEAEALNKDFLDYMQQDQSIYKELSLAVYYAHQGDIQKALKQLRLFSEKENFQYWLILFDDDPQMDALNDVPEARKLWSIIEDRFWKQHQNIRSRLSDQGLLITD